MGLLGGQPRASGPGPFDVPSRDEALALDGTPLTLRLLNAHIDLAFLERSRLVEDAHDGPRVGDRNAGSVLDLPQRMRQDGHVALSQKRHLREALDVKFPAKVLQHAPGLQRLCPAFAIRQRHRCRDLSHSCAGLLKSERLQVHEAL